jgi:hypothetical protein
MLYALWILAGLMLLFWIIGVAGAFNVGSGIHVLLLAAILAVTSTLFTRPRTL